MSEANIQKIVCMAVVSDHFRSQLLGEDRAEILQTSELESKEMEALLSIRAGTIEEFAAGVERILRVKRWAGNGRETLESVAVPGLISVDVPPRRE